MYDLDTALPNALLETMCCLMMGFLLVWAPFQLWRDTFLALEENYERIIFFEFLNYRIRIPVLLYLVFLSLKQMLLTSCKVQASPEPFLATCWSAELGFYN